MFNRIKNAAIRATAKTAAKAYKVDYKQHAINTKDKAKKEANDIKATFMEAWNEELNPAQKTLNFDNN